MKYAYQVQRYYAGWVNGGPIFTSLKKAISFVPKHYKESYRVVRYGLNMNTALVVWLGEK